MSRIASRRLLAQSPLGLFPELTPACRQPARCLRPFSQTSRRKADNDNPFTPTPSPASEPPKPAAEPPQYATPADDFVAPSPSLNAKAGRKEGQNKMRNLFDSMTKSRGPQRGPGLYQTSFASDGSIMSGGPIQQKIEEPHHLHVLATRHNTHITLTSPASAPIISVSCGHIGFKKSARKHYDSAFQLASYVMTRIQDRGIIPQIKQLEVVLRGFGAGREAVTKALLGLEGSKLRPKIVKVSDATRLKFGGSRSRKPRRLG